MQTEGQVVTVSHLKFQKNEIFNMISMLTFVTEGQGMTVGHFEFQKKEINDPFKYFYIAFLSFY